MSYNGIEERLTMMHAITEYQRVCEKAVRAAGALLVDRIGHVAIREKGPSDLVTEADLASQALVTKTILDSFPDHIILGEEDSPLEARPTGEYRWIVDPLDGTTNYVHQYPFFCVSLALEHRGELLAGAIFDPLRKECFTAAKGHGAWLNGRELHVSPAEDLAHAMLGVGLPYNLQRTSPDLLVFIEAAPLCQSVRRTGSAALNLAYLAAGRLDGFWCFSTKIWDVAAGVLMIREAGGVVTSPIGGDFILEKGQFLAAATRPLHESLAALVRRAVA
jgi:myo-inositol-1(or 4)-monophosphatase